MKKYSVLIVFLVLAICVTDVSAQCPMCKTAVESARENGSNAANGLNNGILYLLALPYTIAAVFGGLWFINKRKKVQTS
ncbi:MAG: hypothetical protein ACK574_05020 [Bacteroidota bacterium]|jgi:uncharacterized paraquat-inducible protein A